jgi:hypothetical protein
MKLWVGDDGRFEVFLSLTAAIPASRSLVTVLGI